MESPKVVKGKMAQKDITVPLCLQTVPLELSCSYSVGVVPEWNINTGSLRIHLFTPPPPCSVRSGGPRPPDVWPDPWLLRRVVLLRRHGVHLHRRRNPDQGQVRVSRLCVPLHRR